MKTNMHPTFNLEALVRDVNPPFVFSTYKFPVSVPVNTSEELCLIETFVGTVFLPVVLADTLRVYKVWPIRNIPKAFVVMQEHPVRIQPVIHSVMSWLCMNKSILPFVHHAVVVENLPLGHLILERYCWIIFSTYNDLRIISKVRWMVNSALPSKLAN